MTGDRQCELQSSEACEKKAHPGGDQPASLSQGVWEGMQKASTAKHDAQIAPEKPPAVVSEWAGQDPKILAALSERWIHVNDSHLTSASEQKARETLDFAVLNGDKEAIKKVLQQYRTLPESLTKIIDAVNGDLGPSGTKLQYTVNYLSVNRNEREGDDMVRGNLAIFNPKAPEAAVLSTDPTYKEYTRALKQKHPSAFDQSYGSDAAAALKKIGDVGITKMKDV